MEAVKLAGDLIREHFGERVHRIGELLLHKGRLTQEALVHHSEMPTEEVKSCIMLLIQHDIASFTEEYVSSEATSSSTSSSSSSRRGRGATKTSTEPAIDTYYHINLQNVLWRLRYPKFLAAVNKKFGPAAEMMLQLLIEHGRLTKEQILKHAASLAGVEEVDPKPLLQMVRERFIVRVADAPRPLPPPEVSLASATSSGRARSAKALAADDYDDMDSPGVASVGSSNLNPSFRTGASKRKAPTKAVAGSSLKKANVDANVPTFEEGQVYWRLNNERFNTYFRHEACIDLVREKLDATAGTIIKTMFQMTEPFLQSAKDETSVPVDAEKLHEKMTQGEMLAADVSSYETLKKYLEIMATDKAQMVTRVSSSPLAYVINMNNLSQILRVKMIESIVRDKFGYLSLRIFRLLTIKRQLEQKEIADLSLIPLSETRERLYKMLSTGFVHLQEVPKGSDHMPSRTFYLWSVRIPEIKVQLTEELYKAVRNMRMRLAAELERSQDLERGGPNDEVGELTEQDLQTLSDRLENSVIHLDDTLMVLNDF
ncbi:hypothetical protein QOT17_021178 [Balamuthia mandrillaris]